LWVRHFSNEEPGVSGQSNGEDFLLAPDEARVFAAGLVIHGEPNQPTDHHFGVVAYDARSGDELWRHLQPGWPAGLALSLDGSTLFAAGRLDHRSSPTSPPEPDAGLVAFDAGTGAVTWTSKLPEPEQSGGAEGFGSLALSPDGSRVYAAGGFVERGSFWRIAVLAAFDAATGAHLWTWTHRDPGILSTSWTGVAALPDGDVCVVGYAVLVRVPGREGGIAACVEGATGAPRWSGTLPMAIPFDLAASASELFVAGYAQVNVLEPVFPRAAALDATDGRVLWSREDLATDTHTRGWLNRVAFQAPRHLVIAGELSGSQSSVPLVELLDPVTGQTRWGASFGLAGDLYAGAYGIAPSASGDRVAVAGYAMGPANDAELYPTRTDFLVASLRLL
jgi:outer membrane protein assembly factor BamB